MTGRQGCARKLHPISAESPGDAPAALDRFGLMLHGAVITARDERNIFEEFDKTQGYGNISSEMLVSLLSEGAWPPSAGATVLAEPPRRPSHRPWLGRLYSVAAWRFELVSA